MSNAERDRYLDGQHAVVTGGGKGIGAAVATALAQRGARITILGRSEEALRRHSAKITRECNVDTLALVCDVTEAAQVRDAFRKATKAFGSVSVLVNNAGGAASASFAETTFDVWNYTIALNLTAAFTCIQQVLPHMLEQSTGRIINIASTAALKGYSHTAAYCAAKHGVLGLTRSLAVETAKRGITVNAVCPGYTQTDLTKSAIHTLMNARGISEQEASAMLLKPIPRGEFTQPEEVASAVAWLCSPLASGVTGIAVPVAGGEVA